MYILVVEISLHVRKFIRYWRSGSKARIMQGVKYINTVIH